jgi:hypothetical protein
MLVYEYVQTGVEKRRSTKKEMDRSTHIKTEKAWSDLRSVVEYYAFIRTVHMRAMYPTNLIVLHLFT